MRRALLALGAAVLLGSLWLSWYQPDIPGTSAGAEVEEGFHVFVDGEIESRLSAWVVLSVVDLLLAVLATALIAVAVRPVTRWLPRALATVALALVVARVAAPPENDLLNPAFGAFVALAAALVVTAIAWWPQTAR